MSLCHEVVVLSRSEARSIVLYISSALNLIGFNRFGEGNDAVTMRVISLLLKLLKSTGL